MYVRLVLKKFTVRRVLRTNIGSKRDILPIYLFIYLFNYYLFIYLFAGKEERNATYI